MPPLLGAADSFNSSSATIKADSGGNNQRNLRSSNALGPQDSVGREFDALIGGRIGVLQSDTGLGNTELLSRYLRETATLPGEISLSIPTTNDSTNPTADPSTFDPLSFVADPAAPDADFFAEFETAAATTTTPGDLPGPSTISPFERPGSSLSHRSHHSDYSCSTTEGSYVTTDDDGDSDMMPISAQASPSPLHEIGALNLGSNGVWGVPTPGLNSGVPQSTISPNAQVLGSSARHVAAETSSNASASGSRRRSHAQSFGPEDEEAKRQQRLEHRRSINRRSAQKHRLRRKEEMEELTLKLAERDARIRALEQELAVTQGKLNTLLALVQRGKASQ